MKKEKKYANENVTISRCVPYHQSLLFRIYEFKLM